MGQDVFNIVRSIPIPRSHAQRIKPVSLDQKIKTQFDLYKKILPFYSCHNCVCGDATNHYVRFPHLT